MLRTRTENQRTFTAFHEAGHAVMAHLLGRTLSDRGVTLNEEFGAWNGMTYLKPVCNLEVAAAALTQGDHQLRLGACRQIESEVRISLAGPVAEAVVRGLRLTGRIRGFGGENGDTTVCERYIGLITESPIMVDSVLWQAQRRVARTLRCEKPWTAIENLAARLLDVGAVQSELTEQIITQTIGAPPRWIRWSEQQLARWGYPAERR